MVVWIYSTEDMLNITKYHHLSVTNVGVIACLSSAVSFSLNCNNLSVGSSAK